MSGHTPGPWGLCASSDARSKGYIRPNGPGSTREDGSRPAVCRIVDAGHTAEERRANARLIVAAPDLLAALKDILSWAEDDQEAPGCEAARAAIAKAEGR